MTYSHHNLCHFHQEDGAGYKLIADEVLRIDAFNPHIAARVVAAFSNWRCFDTHRQTLMRKELERMLASSLSSDVYELVSKSLQ